MTLFVCLFLWVSVGFCVTVANRVELLSANAVEEASTSHLLAMLFLPPILPPKHKKVHRKSFSLAFAYFGESEASKTIFNPIKKI